MLDYADEPAWSYDATHLPDKTRPSSWRHVVYNADSGHQIEASVLERKIDTVEIAVADVAIGGARLSDTGGGNVYADETVNHAPQQRMEASDPAADIEHRRFFGPQPLRDQLAQHVCLGAHEKAMRQARKIDR